jgi:hypothetical protein
MLMPPRLSSTLELPVLVKVAVPVGTVAGVQLAESPKAVLAPFQLASCACAGLSEAAMSHIVKKTPEADRSNLDRDTVLQPCLLTRYFIMSPRNSRVPNPRFLALVTFSTNSREYLLS